MLNQSPKASEQRIRLFQNQLYLFEPRGIITNSWANIGFVETTCRYWSVLIWERRILTFNINFKKYRVVHVCTPLISHTKGSEDQIRACYLISSSQLLTSTFKRISNKTKFKHISNLIVETKDENENHDAFPFHLYTLTTSMFCSGLCSNAA